MNKYMIHGGRPLFGEVTISGAKNAAVAIIPAGHVAADCPKAEKKRKVMAEIVERQ